MTAGYVNDGAGAEIPHEENQMILSDRLHEALNRQIGHEIGASMQYIQIATYFDRQALVELARFFYRQSEEEREHAMKIVHFVTNADGTVAIPDVPAPRADFGSAADAVRAALDWEQQVTEQVYELVEIAKEDRNHIAERFLDWFVHEQFEEVSTMSALLQVVERAGEQLLLVEEHLAREHGNVGGAPAPDA
ncbi:MAG: ferritin [Thermoanaerobaculia bacterium]